MNVELAASWLTGLFAFVGLVVCICSGLLVCTWCVVRTRHELRRLQAIWKHESAITEAIAQWKQRNPQRAAELERLRDEVGG